MSKANNLFFLVKSEKEDFPANPRRNIEGKSNSLANFLVVYFEWTFFLCISPYRFVSNKNKEGLFRSWKFYPQILASGILNVLWLNYGLSTCRRVASGSGGTHEGTGSPTAYRYFLVLSFFSSFLFQSFTLKRIWLNRNAFLNIINFIQNCGSLRQGGWFTSKICVHLICLFVMMMGVYEPILQVLPQSFIKLPKTRSIFSVEMVKEARYAFFMINATQVGGVLRKEEITKLDYYLCLMYYLGEIQDFTMNLFPSLLILFGVLTVWMATKQFSAEIQKDIDVSFLNVYPLSVEKKGSRLTWPEIWKGWKVMRELCELVNEAFGMLMSLYLGSCLLFHATGMDAVLVIPSFTLKIRLLFIIILSVITLVLAADVCEKMSAVKLWLAKDENRRTVPNDHLNIILGQLATRDVGIRGSNMFTVTYPLLWSVISTVVTYFIICLQARKEK